MNYARSIIKNRWKTDAPYNILSVEDAHTTNKGEFSVWLYDGVLDENKKKELALAIVMTRSHITDVNFITFDDTNIKKSIKTSLQEGETKWIKYSGIHRNLILVDFSDVQWLMDYMWGKVNASEVNFVSEKDLKKYFKECVLNNTIGQETIDAIHWHKEEDNYKRWEAYVQKALNENKEN